MMAAQRDQYAARNAAPGNLDAHGGQIYDLAVTSAGWVAKRLNDNPSLIAATAAELGTLIAADHATEPFRHYACPEPGRHRHA